MAGRENYRSIALYNFTLSLPGDTIFYIKRKRGFLENEFFEKEWERYSGMSCNSDSFVADWKKVPGGGRRCDSNYSGNDPYHVLEQ